MKYLTILSLLLLTSCLSLRVPHEEVNASKKLGKTLTLTERIVNQYPNLVDSVSSPIPVQAILNEDSIQLTLQIDSLKLNQFFQDYYDPLIRRRDSLITVLDEGLASQEAELAIMSALSDAENKIKDGRTAVVLEVYPDTTMVLELKTDLIINGDSSEINVEALLDINEKGLSLILRIPEQVVETQVESTTPIFKVIRTFPWYTWLGIILGMILVLLVIFRLKK